ncbi:hypothetical protein C8J57DRAFT_1258053 [Mycena rebaudengoi]|nr:hypothetical protein C8J57DRAFT_1258053 [Mycena rebaudengoi]
MATRVLWSTFILVTLVPVNAFDLWCARDQFGPEASLGQYFTHAIPRISGGNEIGGTTLVHDLPLPPCTHIDCTGTNSTVTMRTIETTWPQILQVNPNTYSAAHLPVPRSFTIANGSDAPVTYELVGTISYVHVFAYDDLRGYLVPSSGIGTTLAPDPTHVLLTYNRSSDQATQVNDFLLHYETAKIRYASRPAEAYSVQSTPVPERPPPPLEPPPPPPPATPPALPPPPAQSPPPSYKMCSGYRQVCDMEPNGVDTIQCDLCRGWSHRDCTNVGSFEGTNIVWNCPRCIYDDPDAPAIWTDDIIGKFLMFNIADANGGNYYPAKVMGLSTTGQVLLEWYTGNIYVQGQRPAEKQFTASREECANIYQADPDLNYSSHNTGKIKWPYRLTEGAAQIFPDDFSHPEISIALTLAQDNVLEIILGSRPHPLQSDYDGWMLESRRPEAQANAFLEKFSRNLLSGDASLIEPHADVVFKSLLPDVAATPGVPAALSTTLRLRATTFVALLFELVILRLYLNRSAAEDLAVYFLARKYTLQELRNISADDPFFLEKSGKVIRHLTDPERVLQAAEGAGTEQIPQLWCRIRTCVSRAAAGIPPDLVLASAYSTNGEPYIWKESNNPDHTTGNTADHDNPPSSPSPLRCLCGERTDNSTEPNEVQCEKCRFWSHMRCLAHTSPGTDWNDPDIHFICIICTPQGPDDE